jgi:hypothetical protein
MGRALRMKKWRFLGLFLLAFAAFLVVWRATDAARYYTNALLWFAGLVGPMLHGWVLEIPQPGHGSPTWVHGNEAVQAAIQFDALSVGVVPVLALLAATPGLRWRRRIGLMGLGALLGFAVDTLVVALFPLLVFYKNAFTDVIGTFLGLIAFVGAPVIIWFALTFRELQGWLPLLQSRSLQSH